jgi:hypothetical protein
MRSRSVAVAVTIALVATGGAVASHLRSHQLKSDAQWLMERGSAQAEEYATTLDSRVAEAQLVTFDEHRAVLERSEIWHRTEMLLILLAVVAAFSSYVLYLFRRLREQLVEASAHLEEAPAPRSTS